MKKSLAPCILLAILITLIFTGCSTGNSANSSIKVETPTAEPTPTEKPRKDPLGDMMKEENVTLTAREVQYDMSNNVGKMFGLEGVGELSDYYNWGYDDNLEKNYFCVEVTPLDGNLRENWYIYFDRDSFDKLYKDLIKGDVHLAVLAKIDPEYYDENQQNQASAYEVKWATLK